MEQQQRDVHPAGDEPQQRVPSKVAASPLTPLPWKDGPLFHREARAIYWNDTSKPGKWQRRVDDKGEFLKEDAAYLAHVANAYPRLIEVLHKAAYAGPFARDAEALLRELGETK